MQFKLFGGDELTLKNTAGSFTAPRAGACFSRATTTALIIGVHQ
jgi:hypothetical protein